MITITSYYNRQLYLHLHVQPIGISVYINKYDVQLVFFTYSRYIEILCDWSYNSCANFRLYLLIDISRNFRNSELIIYKCIVKYVLLIAIHI